MSQRRHKSGRRKLVRHYEQPGHAHFLTFSCYRRRPLLSKDRTRAWFVEALAKARETHGFDLWAWVIMPEHVHLLIRPRRDDYHMASILKSVKQPVAARALAFLRETHPTYLERLRSARGHHFWQPRPGLDRNVYEPRTIRLIIDYINNNPVRRQLVQRAIDWHWSSARAWSSLTDVLLLIDFTVPPTVEFPGSQATTEC